MKISILIFAILGILGYIALVICSYQWIRSKGIFGGNSNNPKILDMIISLFSPIAVICLGIGLLIGNAISWLFAKDK